MRIKLVSVVVEIFRKARFHRSVELHVLLLLLLLLLLMIIPKSKSAKKKNSKYIEDMVNHYAIVHIGRESVSIIFIFVDDLFRKIKTIGNAIESFGMGYYFLSLL